MTEDVFLKRYKILKDEVSNERKILYINRVYGDVKITNLLYAESKLGRKDIFAKCLCNHCKSEFYSNLYAITSGNIVSCGCLKSEKAAIIANKKIRIKLIGSVYQTREGFKIIITDVNNVHDVQIEFIEVEVPCVKRTTYQNILKGQIKYPYKIIKNGAYYGVGPYTARRNGKKTKEYEIWSGMLDRCGRSAAYKDVYICKEWLCFQNFAKWYNDNTYDSGLKLSVDKDILTYYNSEFEKFYSPDSCLIIPLAMNIKLENINSKTPEQILSVVNEFKSYLPESTFNKIETFFKDHDYKSNLITDIDSCSKTSLIAGSSLEP